MNKQAPKTGIIHLKAVFSCQVVECAAESTYHADMLRIWNGQPVCETCYKEKFERYDDEGEALVSWHDLPKITLDMVYLYEEDE